MSKVKRVQRDEGSGPVNEYAGWVPTPGAAVDLLPAARTSPRQLWAAYISRRKPVLLDGLLTDATFKAGSQWSNQYLARKAGEHQLMVEKRVSPGEGFGKGRKVAMTFREFLSNINTGDDSLYLTTQQVPVASDGHPGLLGPPLAALEGDFPVQPALTGGLVPQQINLWMGHTSDGASSGLHHDFHDNLYVLLRGRKRFRLWPPSHALRMHTRGQVTRVYPNGRIVYKGQGDVLADGSSARDVARWRARAAADARVAAAEAAVARGDQGSVDALAAAEVALDGLMESELEAMLTGGPGGEDDLADDYVDDEPDSSDGAADLKKVGASGKGDGGSAGSVRNSLEQQLAGSKRKGGRTTNPAAQRGSPAVVHEAEEPPSFCTGVDLTLPDKALWALHPRFPGKAASLEVWVAAGQMLYLPAGWFHEVTSFSEDGREGGEERGGGTEPSCHMALNYWFHPPDRLDSSAAGFTHPYTSDYWPSIWRERCEARERVAAPHPVLIKHDSFEAARVDELVGGTGHDPHRGPQHTFEGVRVDEIEGGTGHDPHRGPQHHFEGVRVDEIEGGTGHDPHRGKGHDFAGVHADELDGGTGHAHPAPAPAPAVGRKSRRKAAAPMRLAAATSAATPVPADSIADHADLASGGRGAKRAKRGAAGGTSEDVEPTAGVEEEKEDGPVDADVAGATVVGVQATAVGDNESGGAQQEEEVDEAALDDPAALGALVSKGMAEYFASEEGAGAMRLALGKYLLEHLMAHSQPKRKQRRTPRQRGRRHHRFARPPSPDEE